MGCLDPTPASHPLGGETFVCNNRWMILEFERAIGSSVEYVLYACCLNHEQTARDRPWSKPKSRVKCCPPIRMTLHPTESSPDLDVRGYLGTPGSKYISDSGLCLSRMASGHRRTHEVSTASFGKSQRLA